MPVLIDIGRADDVPATTTAGRPGASVGRHAALSVRAVDGRVQAALGAVDPGSAAVPAVVAEDGAGLGEAAVELLGPLAVGREAAAVAGQVHVGKVGTEVVRVIGISVAPRNLGRHLAICNTSIYLKVKLSIVHENPKLE